MASIKRQTLGKIMALHQQANQNSLIDNRGKMMKLKSSDYSLASKIRTITSYCAFCLFVCFSMSSGIIVVCLTSPTKPNHVCQLEYITIVSNTKYMNSHPYSITIGDFNNDDHLDLAVTNSNADNIGVFLGYKNGTFAKQLTYSTGDGSRPYSVVTGDLNHDDVFDLIVANYGTHSIGVLRGNGNGTFRNQMIFSTFASRPLQIALDDLNNDTNLDLAVLNFGTNDISIFLGDGGGSFTFSRRLSTGYDSLPSYVVIADLNNDHRPETIVANRGTNNFGIFFGFNNGVFAAQQIYSTGAGSQPSSIAVGDFNNDQILDIAVTKYATNEIGIFFGCANGTFVERTRWTTNISHPFRLALGDLNRDSLEDLIVLYDASDYLSVWLGHGEGIFGNEKQYFIGFQSNPYSIISGDFNHDYRLDIATVNMITNNVGIFLGDNPISFEMQKPYATAADAYPSSIAVEDFNHDNYIDVVVTNTWNDSISIFLGSINGTLGDPILYPTEEYSRPQSMTIADFNNDSHFDLVVVNSGFNSLGIFLGHGDGTFGNQTIHYLGLLDNINSVAVGDFNSDKRIDLAISKSIEGKNIQVYLGYGNGTFHSEASYVASVGFGINSVVVSDLNNDGILDIVALEIYSSAVHAFFGYGNGTFGNSLTYMSNSGLTPCLMTINDLNYDTFPDILVGYCGSSQLGILLGYREEILKNETLYSFDDGFSLSSIVVGDFNNDTQLDIVVTCGYDYFIYALVGHGDGTFSNPVIIYSRLGDYPSAAAQNDFNHDHRQDLIVVNQQSSTISIFFAYDFGALMNQTTYSTGSASYPVFVKVGDFNHDNQSDIVLANVGSNAISVRLGSTNISFSDEIMYSTGVGSQVNSIVVGDFNRDNHLDIAVADSGNDNIGVFLGYGDGTFLNERIYSTSRPLSLAVSDLNNDSWSDIAVANYGSRTIGVFWGYNYTRLVYQTSYAIGNDHTPDFIVVADLNNDNRSDMIVLNYQGDDFSVFLGYNDGHFLLEKIYPTEKYSFPSGGAVGDFNHDGHLDLVITNSGYHYLMIYLGFGNGSFGIPMTYSTGNHSNPQVVVVSDLNNDNKLDMVVANKDSHNIVVFLGHGDGSFGGRITYSLEVSADPQSLVVGDFNNDHHMDIIFGDHTNNRLGLLFGYGNGFFKHKISYVGDHSATPVSIETGDFNNDTYLDIVVINKQSKYIYASLGYGNGSFSDPIVSVPSGDLDLTSITVGDFNDDRLLDICVSDYGGTIIVYHGVGDGFFKHSVTYTVGFATQPAWVVSGYFNTDHYLDIAVANSGSNTVGIFFGDGCEPYSSQMTFSLGDEFRPIAVTVGDVNNDHYMDIIVTNEGKNNVAILMNDGNKSFSNEMVFFTDVRSNFFSVTVADLNNDANLDLITVNRDNESISVFFGCENGTFQYATSYWIGYGSRPNAVTLGDFTNDRHLDIAVSNDGTNNIVLLSGHGNGSFTLLTTFSTGYNTLPCSLDVGDFNNDTIPDVVVAMSATGNIGIISRIC